MTPFYRRWLYPLERLAFTLYGWWLYGWNP